MAAMVRMARPVGMVDQALTVLLALVVLMASMVETVVMETMVFPSLTHILILMVAWLLAFLVVELSMLVKL
jgi:hypothetical protein